jgi:hypothetical protein
MSVKVMASSPLESDATRFVEAAGLQRADVLLWLGDFNYRLNQVRHVGDFVVGELVCGTGRGSATAVSETAIYACSALIAELSPLVPA